MIATEKIDKHFIILREELEKLETIISDSD